MAAMADLIGAEARPTYAEARTGDVQHSVASLERARELLGYAPEADWKTGLATTVAWYRDRMSTARS